MKPQVIAAVLLLFSHAIAADPVEINPPYPALGLIKTVTLEVKNAVTGGCWTNVKHVEANMRLKLSQSGIAVEDEVTKYREPTQAAINVLANGSKVFGNYCVANVEVAIVRNDWAVHDPVYIATVVRLYDKGGVVAGQAPIDNPIASMVDSFITKFASDVLKYRRSPAIQKALEILESN
mgnify:FL=1